MSKKLTQFFISKSDKTSSDSFKIKLEVLMFEFRSDHEADSENKDEISDKVKEVLKIIKKWVKSFIKKSASDSSSSDSSSNSDESDHWSCKKCSKHHHHCCHDTESDFNSDSDFDISLKYQKVKITSLKSSDNYIIWESSMKIILMHEDTLRLVKNKLKKLKNNNKSHYK